jgi:hypothetical protein
VGPAAADLCEWAEDLCRRVAPNDLAGLPLYVVAQSAIRETFGEARATYGYTLSRLDLILRDQIGPAWQGRGPCIVVSDLALAEDFGDFVPTNFLATALHELAHVFERGMTFAEEPELSTARLIFDGLVVARAMDEPVPNTERPQRFLQHDDRFLRAVLHMRHRANGLGVHLGRDHILPADQLMLYSVGRYRAALDDELDRFIGLGIRTILSMAPPPPFARLWAEELAFQSESLFPKETTP